MSEFVPGWMLLAAWLYLGATTLTSLVAVGWTLSTAGGKPQLSPSGFADAFRGREIVAIYVLYGVALVGIAAGVRPPAEVAAVAGGLFVAAKLQLHLIKATVAYHSAPRGETA